MGWFLGNAGFGVGFKKLWIRPTGTLWREYRRILSYKVYRRLLEAVGDSPAKLSYCYWLFIQTAGVACSIQAKNNFLYHRDAMWKAPMKFTSQNKTNQGCVEGFQTFVQSQLLCFCTNMFVVFCHDIDSNKIKWISEFRREKKNWNRNAVNQEVLMIWDATVLLPFMRVFVGL